ncbi:hypothetical protein ACS0TY_022617 [Phlomoides rotata]
MIEGRRAGPPHAIIIAAVVAAALLLPTLFGDEDDAISNFVGAAEVLSPVGLLLLPIALILTIHFLSSAAGSFVAGIFSSSTDRNSIHRASASPVGVVMVLLLVLLLLYYKVSIFSGYDDNSE